MHPPDAEADARRPQPVREREERGLTAPWRRRSRSSRRRRRTPPGSRRPWATPSTASARLRSRSSRLSIRKTARWPPESAGFRTAGSGTSASAASTSADERTAAKGGCGTPALGEGLPHEQLVRHPVCGLDPDAREPELVGDSGDDRYGPICGDGHHPVDVVPPTDLRHSLDVREVDELADVRRLEAECVSGCGRPRRRGGRALAPAGSRGAGDARLRRRGRSSAGPLGLGPRRRASLRAGSGRGTRRSRPWSGGSSRRFPPPGTGSRFRPASASARKPS